MGSEAIIQPVSQCFPDNSRVRRSLPRMLRREGAHLVSGGGKGYLVPYLVVLGREGVVNHSYFPSLILGFWLQATILEAFSYRTRVTKTHMQHLRSWMVSREPGQRHLWGLLFHKGERGSPLPTLHSHKARKCLVWGHLAPAWRWLNRGFCLPAIGLRGWPVWHQRIPWCWETGSRFSSAPVWTM